MVKMMVNRFRMSIYVGCLIAAALIYFKFWIRPDDRAVPPRIQSLTADGDEFALDGRPFRILSGSIHYFRVVPIHWSDRLAKLKAMGLNTVQTYVAWNFHESTPGRFDFTTGMRDVGRFVRAAHSLGLHVIVRPGPYICAEWEHGGLPAWLLRDKTMKLRSMHPGFIAALDRYFEALMKILAPLQRVNGGPIIAFQAENEYGNYGNDVSYVEYVAAALRRNGVTELIFTSDNHDKKPFGSLLQTINFQRDVSMNIAALRRVQPNRPLMVAEYWPGWFDHWTDSGHHGLDVDETAQTVARILDEGASINFYMFHGGTNFAFYNGADRKSGRVPYMPVVTSYDYDAPLDEAGDPTEKYRRLREILQRYVASPLPPVPPPVQKTAYASVTLNSYAELVRVSQYAPVTASRRPLPMELLSVRDGVGQAFGFALYVAQISSGVKTVGVRGVRDRAVVMIDGRPMKTIELNEKDAVLELDLKTSGESVQLAIIVENCGRLNVASGWLLHWFDSKGITGSVSIDGEEKDLTWNTFSLDFSTEYVESITKNQDVWRATPVPGDIGPILLKGELQLAGDEPSDTFVSMEVSWAACLFREVRDGVLQFPYERVGLDEGDCNRERLQFGSLLERWTPKNALPSRSSTPAGNEYVRDSRTS